MTVERGLSKGQEDCGFREEERTRGVVLLPGRRMKSAFLTGFERFLKENPTAVFFLGFQALIIACALLLIFGLGSAAEGVAIVGYLLLVIGVARLTWLLRRDSDGR